MDRAVAAQIGKAVVRRGGRRARLPLDGAHHASRGRAPRRAHALEPAQCRLLHSLQAELEDVDSADVTDERTRGGRGLRAVGGEVSLALRLAHLLLVKVALDPELGAELLDIRESLEARGDGSGRRVEERRRLQVVGG